jgi:hypothetical protein
VATALHNHRKISFRIGRRIRVSLASKFLQR